MGLSSTELADVRAELAAVFADVLKIHVPSPDADLLTTGLLDSIGFVNLLVELERRLGVQVALESLEPENFSSLERIAEFVVAQRDGAA